MTEIAPTSLSVYILYIYMQVYYRHEPHEQVAGVAGGLAVRKSANVALQYPENQPQALAVKLSE